MWNYNHWTGTTGRKRSTTPPENKFLLYFWVWRENFWSMLTLNLIVILFSLPVITIFPALAAMNRILYNMIEDKPLLLFMEFKSIFKKEFKPAVIAGIPIVILGAVLILLGGFFGETIITPAVSLACFIGLGILYMIAAHVLGMIPYLELSVAQCYKNAFLLLILCLGRNIVSVLVLALLAMLFVLGHPLTTPVLFFFAVPIFGYFTAFQTHISIKKYLVQPVDIENAD